MVSQSIFKRVVLRIWQRRHTLRYSCITSWVCDVLIPRTLTNGAFIYRHLGCSSVSTIRRSDRRRRTVFQGPFRRNRMVFSPDNRIHRQSLDEQGRDGQPGQGPSFRAASSARFEAGFLSLLGGLDIGAFDRASSVPGGSGALAALLSRRTWSGPLVCGLNSPRVCEPPCEEPSLS